VGTFTVEAFLLVPRPKAWESFTLRACTPNAIFRRVRSLCGRYTGLKRCSVFKKHVFNVCSSPGHFLVCFCPGDGSGFLYRQGSYKLLKEDSFQAKVFPPPPFLHLNQRVSVTQRSELRVTFGRMNDPQDTSCFRITNA
jgi:hypothetical protein